MACGFVAGLEFSAQRMLAATVDALATMDSARLELLLAEAEGAVAGGVRLEASEAANAVTMKLALSELLCSTDRSLRMLRGLHEGRVRRMEEEAWAR